ncbi:MAG: glucose-6-phosphate dehydrogenase [Acidimicrobiales bacterium]
MGPTLVILGAVGDLTARFVVPALAELSDRGSLPEDLSVIGVARHDMSTEDYLDTLREDDSPYVDICDDAVAGVHGRITYVEADATDSDALGELPVGDDGPVFVYFALPPAVFPDAFRAVAGAPWGDRARFAIEKPFGEDLESARALNAVLADCTDESRVFRVDHFLGHSIARALLGLRAANRMFDATLDAAHVDRIDVIWDETIALEGRAGYYDGMGALRDMLQNHLLQLMVLLTMDLPAGRSAAALAEAKVARLRTIQAHPGRSVRGRYSAGSVDGVDVPSYVDEDDVDPDLETETFAEIELSIDDDRWRGVPIRLRSGKALAEKRSCLRVTMKDDSGDLVACSTRHHVELGIEPGSVELRLGATGDADAYDLGPMTLSADLPGDQPSAYASVLADLFAEDPHFFVSGPEAEEQWRIVAPVLDAWENGEVPLVEYPAGSDGPS